MAESHNAHTAVPSDSHKGPFPPFQADSFASQLIWLALIFITLYIVMAKLALPRIGGIIESRRTKIADDLTSAQRFKEDSDAAIAAYEKKLADARANAQAIGSKTRDELMAKAEARRKVTEEALNKKLEAAEKTIAATKTDAMSNVRSIATETAAAIVERLIGAAPSEKTVADAVTQVLKR